MENVTAIPSSGAILVTWLLAFASAGLYLWLTPSAWALLTSSPSNRRQWMCSFLLAYMIVCFVQTVFTLTNWLVSAQVGVLHLTFLGFNNPSILLTGFIACLAISICEETFFRGIVFGGLKKVSPISLALVAQAVIFAALHMSAQTDLFAFATLLVGGLLLGYFVYHYGTLAISIGIHTSWNWMLMSIFPTRHLGVQYTAFLDLEITRTLVDGSAKSYFLQLFDFISLVIISGLAIYLVRRRRSNNKNLISN